jgi:hypothetical protein
MKKSSVVLVLVLVLEARAHQAPHPKRLSLQLSPDRITVLIDFTVAGGEPARALRQSFDRDRNGRLDDSERALLAEHLAKTAALRTRIRRVELNRAAPPRLDGELADSTQPLSIRVALHGAWPDPDWLGRRTLVVEDESPAGAGHVPVSATCEGCSISSISAAEITPAAPLEVKVRLGGGGWSCGG